MVPEKLFSMVDDGAELLSGSGVLSTLSENPHLCFVWDNQHARFHYAGLYGHEMRRHKTWFP